MIFYDCSTAPSPRRARILLAEKGAPHTTVQVDMGTGELLGEAFRAINPSCTIPVLQLDDGTILTENAGIAAYLEDAFPNPSMMGSTAAEKGLVAAWNAKTEIDGLHAVAEALRNSSPRMKGRALTGATDFQQIPELASRGLQRLELFFDRLNERLEGRDFIAIDEFSYADITAVVVVDFARVVKVKAQEHQTNLIRWRESLANRPSLTL